MSPARTLPWVLLHLCAAFAFLVETGRLGSPRPPDLSRLPAQLGALELLDEIPVAAETLGEQPPERFTYRRVRDAQGREGRFFAAWYERAQRWSGRPHDLEKCYAALGWAEREARQIDGSHHPWSRLFERDGDDGPEAIRVVHWLEHPGPDQDRLAGRELLARLGAARGFRPDVVSAYFEFPARDAPSEEVLAAAADALAPALAPHW